MIGLPVVANAIAGSLAMAVPSNDPAAWRGIDALIVLDGDNRRGRVREARLAYDVARPAEVWVFGDAWMLDPLLQSGIPYDRIKFGGDTANTRDQMARVKMFADRASTGRGDRVLSADAPHRGVGDPALDLTVPPHRVADRRGAADDGRCAASCRATSPSGRAGTRSTSVPPSAITRGGAGSRCRPGTDREAAFACCRSCSA